MPGFWDDDEIKKAAEGAGYTKLTDIGDTVSGAVRSLNKRKFDDRTAIEITFEDDTKFTAGQVLLLRDLYVLQPTPGDQLTITLADIEKRGPKTLKLFKVEVVRPNGTVDIIDQTDK